MIEFHEKLISCTKHYYTSSQFGAEMHTALLYFTLRVRLYCFMRLVHVQCTLI